MVDAESAREALAMTINAMADVQALGLPVNAVFQADTLEAPTTRPFVVIRWGQATPGSGRNNFRPFELWGYDDKGDYTRIESIVTQIRNNLIGVPPEVVDPILTNSGWILKIEDNKIGLGRGQDSFDVGFDCVVLPWRMQAVANGQ